MLHQGLKTRGSCRPLATGVVASSGKSGHNRPTSTPGTAADLRWQERVWLQGQAACMCACQLTAAYPASQAIAKYSGDVFIPRGVDVPALDRSISYEFAPQKVKVRLGAHCIWG